MKDYYEEINETLRSYENRQIWHPNTIDWACNRIDWCWKWKKITKEQMVELADRATAIFDENLFVD